MTTPYFFSVFLISFRPSPARRLRLVLAVFGSNRWSFPGRSVSSSWVGVVTGSLLYKYGAEDKRVNIDYVVGIICSMVAVARVLLAKIEIGRFGCN